MKILTLTILATAWLTTVNAADKKIVFIAGKASHAPGDHEHRAGCLLLQACLPKTPGLTSVVYSNGWPDRTDALTGADTVVIYADGGGGHPLLQSDRLAEFGKLMDRGVGLVLIHYAVEPTREKGQPQFLDWVGGAFEIDWSVNPVWTADFKSLPAHPITRGVQPFKLRDEWYFHMRFRDGMRDVTAILNAVPEPSTTNRNDGPHSGNPAVRAAVKQGVPQTVAWAAERANGGRGFGFTGAHYHRNWENDEFRKTVLNAILWTAKMDVPAGGVASHVTPELMQANLDDKTERKR
jgi:type 1 glutamine amidotransferase